MDRGLRRFYEAAHSTKYRVFFAFAVVALCCFFYLVLTQENQGDDTIYYMQAHELRLPAFWAEHSRLVIDTAQYVFMHLPLVVWQLCNAAVYGLLAFLVCNLLWGLRGRPCSAAERILVCAGVFYLGIIDCTVGVITTQCNYTWPLCAALLALLPLQHAYFGPAACAWSKPMPILALLAIPYAANQHLTAAVLCGFLLVGAVLLARRRDRAAIYCALQLLLGLACAGWLLYRSLWRIDTFAEQDMYFPGYYALPLPQKLEYGLSSTAFFLLHERIAPSSVLMLLFAAWLFYCTLVRVRKWLPRCAAAVPLGMQLVFCSMWYLPSRPGFGMLLRGTPWSRVFGYVYRPEPWLDLVLLLSLACVCFGICACLGSFRRALPCLLILFAGFGARLLMCLTPNAYASGLRTFQCFFAALLVCAFVIAPQRKKAKKEKEPSHAT